MNPVDILVILLILAAVIWALLYIRRVKRSGGHCVGCSGGSSCPHCNSQKHTDSL